MTVVAETSAEKYNAYSRYIDIREGWIGRIPAAWRVWRLKHVARLESGHTPSRSVSAYWDDCTIPWVSLSDVGPLRTGTVDYIEDTAEKISELGLANSAARLLPAGTVVLSRTASVGFAGILARPMATTQDFANWVCGDRLLPKYLLHCLRAMREDFRRITDGSTHQTIYMPDIERLAIPLPSTEEQEAIAAFVDRSNVEANGLIAAKERLNHLLAEQRAALIIDAVRHGVERDMPLASSEIEWAKEMPAHWDVRPLKYSVLGCRNGVWGDEPASDDEDIAVIRVADFDRVLRRVADGERTFRRISEADRKSRLLTSGDLLIEKSGGGDKQPVGCVVLWDRDEEAVSSNFIARMPVASGYDPAYLAYLHEALFALRVNVKSIKQSTGIQNLDADQYLSERAPFPPLEEQRAIASYLADRTGRIDTTLQRARAHIILLREYRDALCHAAVTGRIKVT